MENWCGAQIIGRTIKFSLALSAFSLLSVLLLGAVVSASSDPTLHGVATSPVSSTFMGNEDRRHTAPRLTTANMPEVEEYVSGTIIQNTTWFSSVTYILTGDVGIAPGVVLTIQPGTVIKVKGNYSLKVGGTLVADGLPDRLIVFTPYSAGTWGQIYFDDSSLDAVADASGEYQSGTILRHVNVQGAVGGLTCYRSSPYLSNVNLDGGGVTCGAGSEAIWLRSSWITGDVSINGVAHVWETTLSQGNLTFGKRSDVLRSMVNGSLSLPAGGIISDTVVTNGGVTLDLDRHSQSPSEAAISASGRAALFTAAIWTEAA